MYSIRKNLEKLKSELPKHVTLVAVSKTKPAEAIMDAYNTGQRIFGENKVQEMADKHDKLPSDIQWHLIGHLQTNKVKYIAPFVSMIHSVDSLKLLQIINSEALKNNRIIDCLLQIRIAKEETKFGMITTDVLQLLQSAEFKNLQNVRIRGLMGMATFTDDENQIRSEFRNLSNTFNQLKSSFFATQSDFTEISMGMSDDHKIAIEEGSTMIRVGSNIFGARVYS